MSSLAGFILRDDIGGIAMMISKDWKRLGRLLLLFEHVLDNIDACENIVSEKAKSMLTKWQNVKGSSAAYKDLYNALCQVERKDLAEKYCLKQG